MGNILRQSAFITFLIFAFAYGMVTWQLHTLQTHEQIENQELISLSERKCSTGNTTCQSRIAEIQLMDEQGVSDAYHKHAFLTSPFYTLVLVDVRDYMMRKRDVIDRISLPTMSKFMAGQDTHVFLSALDDRRSSWPGLAMAVSLIAVILGAALAIFVQGVINLTYRTFGRAVENTHALDAIQAHVSVCAPLVGFPIIAYWALFG